MRSQLVLLLGLMLIGCNSDNDNGKGDQKESSDRTARNWSELPREVTIDSLANTEFVPTLESRIDAGKNIVYAAAMLYAWDEFKKIAGRVTVPDTASEDLKKVNNSRSHQDVLDKDEYSAAGELVEGRVEVRAFFSKILPFASELQATEPIPFGKDTVRAFGASTFTPDVSKQISILYYRSDSQFVLSLHPADSTHQIIIAMGVPKVQTLSEAVRKVKASVLAGENEKKRSANARRYQFEEGDIVSIPEFRFNVSKHYQTLEGQSVITGSVERSIAVAYQRTALVLNKYGAVVESEAVLTTSTDSAEVAKPKRMICNRPFYVIIQHRGRDNPYFVMKVENGELMEKE